MTPLLSLYLWLVLTVPVTVHTDPAPYMLGYEAGQWGYFSGYTAPCADRERPTIWFSAAAEHDVGVQVYELLHAADCYFTGAIEGWLLPADADASGLTYGDFCYQVPAELWSCWGVAHPAEALRVLQTAETRR